MCVESGVGIYRIYIEGSCMVCADGVLITHVTTKFASHVTVRSIMFIGGICVVDEMICQKWYGE